MLGCPRGACAEELAGWRTAVLLMCRRGWIQTGPEEITAVSAPLLPRAALAEPCEAKLRVKTP